MPFCDVSKYEKGRESFAEEAATSSSGDGIKIFYRRYGQGSTKVLLIIGLAGTHDGWGPQVKGLTGRDDPNDDGVEAVGENFDGMDEEDPTGGGIEVCCFDNRGMGRSSVPTKKPEYTTTKMAKDALALLDHLNWKKAHVFGHSMGAMIACKLAAMAPERLSSLALLNVTGGGFDCFPKVDRQMISLAIRFLRAKTPEQRAMVDLETHYTKEYLEESHGSSTRRKILYHVRNIAFGDDLDVLLSLYWKFAMEYVKAISSTGMQSNYGFEGQVNACWTHNMSSKELGVIRSAGFLVLVLHGRYDIIAQVRHARKLADKLRPAARMVELHGAHLVSHERPEEVNHSLLKLIEASEYSLSLHEWSRLLQNESGGVTLGVSVSSNSGDNKEATCLMSAYGILGKLQLIILYFFGIFVLGFEHARKAFRLLKPARVGATIS